MRCRLVTWIVGFSLVLALYTVASGVEKLDRGLVALKREDGSVFLSWRLLADDPPDMAFTVMRVPDGLSVPDQWTNLTKGRPYRQANFVDKEQKGTKLWAGYALYRFSKDRNLKESQKLDFVGVFPKPYITIPLKGNYDFQKVGIGDLDGDGKYEFIIKQPNFNTDPYQKPGYWKRSPTTYKLEAYRLDGTMMWRYDMGWAIEAGIWYSPWIVYDIDGDGKAEVYCKAGEGDPREEAGHVESGPEYLVKIDGETGKIVAKTDWLSREGFSSYNYYCRNFLTVAYLDGKKPSMVMQRGTYNLIKISA